MNFCPGGTLQYTRHAGTEIGCLKRLRSQGLNSAKPESLENEEIQDKESPGLEEDILESAYKCLLADSHMVHAQGHTQKHQWKTTPTVLKVRAET